MARLQARRSQAVAYETSSRASDGDSQINFDHNMCHLQALRRDLVDTLQKPKVGMMQWCDPQRRIWTAVKMGAL